MNCKKCDRILTAQNIFAVDEDVYCRDCYHVWLKK